MRKLAQIAGASLLLISGPGLAQTITGSIFGAVVDGTTAPVPGAHLRLVSAATRAERLAETDHRGEFVFTALPPGSYSLSVEATGFKTLVRENIYLTPSERLSVGTLTLELGTLTERVTVSAAATPVQTSSTERSTAITAYQVSSLPIYSRVVTTLVALSPGVVDPIGAGARRLGGGGGGAINFNMAGGRNVANNFTVDGITMNAVGGAPNAAFGIAMESVAEVKVMVSNYQAEYGRRSGGVVQIVTKSGTQEFHGVAMYYMRNEVLNANNFFNNRLGQPRSRNRFNAMTYSLGGPVYIPRLSRRSQPRMFFYWSHEYQPAKVTGALQYSTMPTALERAGDFSQSLDVNAALIPVRDPLTGTPFSGNKVPPSRLDPNGQALLGVFPAPNFLDRAISRGNYNYVTRFTGKNPLSLYTLKLDYNISPKDIFSATYAYNKDDDTTPNPGGISAPFPILGGATRNAGRLVTGRYTRVFSPTIMNETVFGYAQMFGPMATGLSSEVLKAIQRRTYGFQAGQLNPANNPLDFLPGMSFAGVVGAAGMSYDGRFPYWLTRYTTDASQAVSVRIGGHLFKAGIFYERMRQYDGGWASNFNGTFDFGRNVNNPLDSNHPYSNAVLGIFNSYTEATSRPVNLRNSTGLEWYLQDHWMLGRRLTLDYGVRFTWWTPFVAKGAPMATFNPDFYDPGQRVMLIYPTLSGGRRAGMNPVTGQIHPAALIGFIAPGAGTPINGMVVNTQVPGYPRGLVQNIGPVAAPRLGLAYDPFGTGKTAIRAGLGIFYDRVAGGANTDAVFSFPIVHTPVIYFDRISGIHSAQGFLAVPSVAAWQKNIKCASTINLSLSIQRDVGFGAVVDLGYLGSLGRHLTWQRDINSIPLGTRFLAANRDPTNPAVPLPDVFLRPIVGYGSMQFREAAGSSNYHSLQFTANRRMLKDLAFTFAWTWSKALGYTDSEFGAVNIVAPFREWNYGLAGFDRTHVVKLTWIWNVPGFRGAVAPVRAILNGWQVLGIATFSSGAPVGVGYSLVSPVDLSGTPSISPRILVVGNPVLPRSKRTFTQAFRTDVFRVPEAGTLGTMSKTLLRGPGINSFDISVFKNFSILRERLRIQLRGEFYNAFNHTQFASFDASARFDSRGAQVNAQFGQYTSARDPRVAQLALRVEF